MGNESGPRWTRLDVIGIWPIREYLQMRHATVEEYVTGRMI